MTDRKIILAIVLACLFAIVVFLACAFIKWDLNPSSWGQPYRAFSVFLMLISGIVSACVVIGVSTEEEEW